MRLQVFLLSLVSAVFATSVPANPYDKSPRPFDPLIDCPADGPCHRPQSFRNRRSIQAETELGYTSVPVNPFNCIPDKPCYKPPLIPTYPVNPLIDCPADGSCFTQPSTTYLPGGNNIYNQIGYNYDSYQDQRSAYFYAAPDDEEAARLRVYIQPSSRRNTKLIFIKAPSQGGVVPEVIAPPSEALDRTLVYVLSKKQKDGGSVTIPANLGIKQAKPEVYYVKYRNQHDIEGAVQQGLNGQGVGTGLDDLGNAQVFSRTLEGSRGFANVGFSTGVPRSDGGVGTNYGPPSGSGPY